MKTKLTLLISFLFSFYLNGQIASKIMNNSVKIYEDTVSTDPVLGGKVKHVYTGNINLTSDFSNINLGGIGGILSFDFLNERMAEITSDGNIKSKSLAIYGTDIDQERLLLRGKEGDINQGVIEFRNQQGHRTIKIDGQAETYQHGRISFYDGEGSRSPLIRLNANYQSSGFSRFTLANEAKKPQVIIKSGEASIDQGVIEVYNSSGNRTIKIDGQAGYKSHAHISLWDGINKSKKTIEINSNWNGSGNSRIQTDVLEITGGSDLSEKFSVTEGPLVPKPGMLVSIDPKNEGKLMITESKNDRKIAGIISGAKGINTGLLMSQKESIADGDYPVALTGRTYVLANMENGDIVPGDFMTSSSTLGQAMKVLSFEKSQGSIIGKAMSKIDNQGYVLVLVNLN